MCLNMLKHVRTSFRAGIFSDFDAVYLHLPMSSRRRSRSPRAVQAAQSPGQSAQVEQLKQLKLLHITKNAGTALEKLGKETGLKWGKCWRWRIIVGSSVNPMPDAWSLSGGMSLRAFSWTIPTKATCPLQWWDARINVPSANFDAAGKALVPLPRMKERKPKERTQQLMTWTLGWETSWRNWPRRIEMATSSHSTSTFLTHMGSDMSQRTDATNNKQSHWHWKKWNGKDGKVWNGAGTCSGHQWTILKFTVVAGPPTL